MHCRLGASARKATAVAVNPDLSTATAAVHRSAASLGATLTPGRHCDQTRWAAAGGMRSFSTRCKLRCCGGLWDVRLLVLHRSRVEPSLSATSASEAIGECTSGSIPRTMWASPEIITGPVLHAAYLLEYESIVCLRGRISRVLRLMHNTGGDIIRLSGRESFP
jgi:hypothetical protein